jgi:serine/threonine protein kinase
MSVKVHATLESSVTCVPIELLPQDSIQEALFRVEEGLHVVHQRWGLHKLKRRIPGETLHRWYTPSKPIGEQVPPVSDGETMVITGEIEVDIGVDLKTVKQYSLNEFTFVRNLGSGAFGDVSLYRHNVSRAEYAVKTIMTWDPTSRSYTDLVRELTILKDAHHHAVLGLEGFIHPEGPLAKPSIVLPFMTNGSLAKIVNQAQAGRIDAWTYTAKYIAIYGSALGMEYLHSLGVIHRDLKPENVLLDSNYDPKITDFGLSKVVKPGTTVEQSIFGGTMWYQAPEIMQSNKHYSQKVDVYAFGIMMFVVFTGLEPFDKKATHWIHANRVLIQGIRPTIPKTIPERIAELMRCCWDGAPETRLTFEQVVRDLESAECLRGVDMQAFRAYQVRARVQETRLETAALATVDAEPSPYGVLKAQADSGDVRSQLEYASELLSGDHIPKDCELAYRYLLRAEEAGNVEAKVKIGELLLAGIVGVDQPQTRRSAAYKRFDSVRREITDPKNGHRLRSLHQLGRCLEHGWGVFPDNKKALAMFREAAQNGFPESEARYALFLDLGRDTVTNPATALEFYKRASDHALPEGMFSYGKRLQDGTGIARDVRQAVRLYELAANHGYVTAYFTLWGIYTNGLAPVQRDPDLALRNARLGAERRVVGCMLEYADLTRNAELGAQALGRGLAKEQLAFGRMYTQDGVWRKNVGRAIDLFEAARRDQPSIGFCELGRLLLEERPARRAEGIDLLRQGSEALNPDCCAFLGRCLRKGIFPEEVAGEAIKVLERAAPLKHSQSLIELGKAHLKSGSPTSQVHKFFKLAYHTGTARGAKWFARCFQNGWGVAPDRQMADRLMAEVAQRKRSEDADATALLMSTMVLDAF